MPRRTKGPRLYLQGARAARPGKPAESAVWVIRDGGVKRSTGAGASEIGKARQALTDYLNKRKDAAPRVSNRDPAAVLIADVIALYAQDVAPKHARPNETAGRLKRVLDQIGHRPLAYLNKSTCQAYVEARGFGPAARRELEDLRAAIRHHWQEGLCSALTPIVLPQRGDARERWLTRPEAARLLLAALRLRPKGNSLTEGRRTGAHVARFILAGLYTGTRAGTICAAALTPQPGLSFLDTEHGVFYRRRAGRRKTKKRQPSIRIPPRFLAHARRWIRLGIARSFLVEWEGRPVKRVNKAFRACVKAANLGADVTPHTLRHTAITWQAQLGVPAHEICGFFGITMEVFERVYGHHHPDFQANAVNALSRRRQVTRHLPDRISETERERTSTNVVAINEKR